jgi:hypothetical protein
MSHLGRWLTALVDDEVDEVERDRMLNHLARCEACLREANALRALKRRMTALGQTSTDPMFTGRLIERAMSAPGWTPGFAPAAADFAAWGDRSGVPIWKVAAASLGAALISVGAAAFLLGGTRSAAPGPVVTPAVDVYWLEHNYDTGQVPAAQPTPAIPAGQHLRTPASPRR